MIKRLAQAQGNAVVLGDCLVALLRDEDPVDARVGAIVVGEFINMVRGALKKK